MCNAAELNKRDVSRFAASAEVKKVPMQFNMGKKNQRQYVGSQVLEAYVALLVGCIYFHDRIPTFGWEIWTPYKFFDLAEWMGSNMWIPLSLAVFYLVSIFGIQEYMKDKKKFQWKNAMTAWNLFLALFSFWGSVRTVPQAYTVFKNLGVHGMMCGFPMDEFAVGTPAGAWCAIFLLSKIPELMDTYFIVLQGKKLITLHWVHHFTVMIVSWHGLASLSLNGLPFVCMNFTIHAAMYFFYFLGGIGYRPTKYAKVTTVMQILQMVCGFGITVYLKYNLIAVPFKNEIGVPSFIKLTNREKDEWEIEDPGHCMANATNMYLSCGIYITYFILFSHFYINAYKIRSVRKPSKSKAKIDSNKDSIPQKYKDDGKKMYMKIDGVVYDIKSFSRKHPGGAVIRHYDGADASQVFEAFHFRSKKARKILKSLPVLQEDGDGVKVATVNTYPGQKGDSNEMLKEFNGWRDSLVERGFFEPSIVHCIYRQTELVVLYLFSCFAFSRGYYFAGISFLGICGGRAGWLMHEGGHGSLTGNISLDKMIQCFWYGFMDGLSGSAWNSMHNRHHASTQKIKHDTDLDTLPLVAFHKEAVEHNENAPFLVSSGWLKFQHYFFFFITAPLVLSFWSYFLHPMTSMRKRKVAESFWMVVGHIWHTAMVMKLTGVSVLAAYGIFWLSRWWSAVYIFGHFSLSHTHLPTISHDEHSTWVDQALEHTCDIETQNPVVNWIMGYLNCQVIHHLFPQMPQFRHPQVSKELEVFAAKWGRSYHHISYLEAWRRTITNLKDVGEHYSSKEKDH